ncbi:MarR family transcriptional regulator [Clostridium beijerinckii]|nr:MarR family transcriptional regulator [Clostridium beijerinckii]
MDKKAEVIDKIVNAYFEQPEKTLEEVFGEYTEDLTQEEKEKFFNNLKAIIN